MAYQQLTFIVDGFFRNRTSYYNNINNLWNLSVYFYMFFTTESNTVKYSFEEITFSYVLFCFSVIFIETNIEHIILLQRKNLIKLSVIFI